MVAEVTGVTTDRLDEAEYRYPTVDIKHLHIWKEPRDAYARNPGPWWGVFGGVGIGGGGRSGGGDQHRDRILATLASPFSSRVRREESGRTTSVQTVEELLEPAPLKRVARGGIAALESSTKPCRPLL